MLNYLGSGIGPGTMPSAVPGTGQTGSALGPIRGPAPVAPNLASAVRPAMDVTNPGAPGLVPPPNPDDPSQASYAAVTQADGSILLHIKNADGSLGPAVKIVSPIKPKQ